MVASAFDAIDVLVIDVESYNQNQNVDAPLLTNIFILQLAPTAVRPESAPLSLIVRVPTTIYIVSVSSGTS